MPSTRELFTVILDTYYRPALLKQAVEALFRQTYGDLEIILVNNGATPETVEYLRQVEAADRRVKLVHFRENQYSEDDPLKMVDTCLNAALEVATGAYVWYQSDDDLMADDYAEKMVALFQGHPDCATAAGLPVCIDVEGRRLEPGPRISNYRPRYMPGHLLALETLKEGGNSLFSAPGTIFTIRREILVRAGGYHRSVEMSQLYGIVPFGVTGFDETALFYWRRHGNQINRQLSARGWLGLREAFQLLKDWEIEPRWRVFGEPIARQVVAGVDRQTCQMAAQWFAIHAGYGRVIPCGRILREIWTHPAFWRELPARLAREGGYTMRRFIKSCLARLFAWWPGLGAWSPQLSRLRRRVMNTVS